MGTDVGHAEPAAMLMPSEVASLFGVTPRTIARWDAAGLLPGERTIGGHRRFPAGAVYELLEFLEGVGGP
ncbi:MAG: excisionase [Ilumatobacteraceae bacterium]|nr:excisionase [Ilumatobacteraceae bacterium]